ncbi:hypothetical protein ACHAWC_003416 [Mediolabrus comicus]
MNHRRFCSWSLWLIFFVALLHKLPVCHSSQRQTQSSAFTGYNTIDGYPCYRSVEGTNDFLRDLATTYPNLVTLETIGESYIKMTDGNKDKNEEISPGYDIYAINITDTTSIRQSSEKGKLLITSGIHAREYTPTELTGRFIEMLIEGYNSNDAEITSILQHTEIHIIIHVNPDGRYMAERFPDTYWRKNMNSNDGCKNDEFVGVDLNRNFDFLWGDKGGASSDSCSDEYHGSGPNSEPETQAVINYAKKVFPVSQRRDDPEKQMNEPLDEDIMGVYIDVHSTGRYIYYPWGHRDATSPNDDAFQAIARKMSHYNGYDLWASGYDFLYPVSGDSSDYMYAVMGVASLGLELGFNWYESCNAFENVILPNNLPALLYAASIASKPLSLAKGPDVLDVVVDYSDNGGDILVTAEVSEGIMVNSLNGEADHVTGDQDIVQVTIYFDVHPDDFIDGELKWEMSPIDGDFDGGEEVVDVTISTGGLPSGSHILHLQAMDSSGYLGPVKSVSIQIEKEETNTPTSAPITALPTPSPTTNSPTLNPTPSPTTPEPSGNPTTASPSPNPTQAPIVSPVSTPLPTPAPAATTISPSHTATTPPSNTATKEPNQTPSPMTSQNYNSTLKPSIVEVNMNNEDITVVNLPVNGSSNTSSASMKALTGMLWLITYAPAVCWLSLSLLS